MPSSFWYWSNGKKNASENREEGKRDKKAGRKQNPEQERIRIFKQCCCVCKSYMEERVGGLLKDISESWSGQIKQKKPIWFMSEPISYQQKQSYRSITSGKDRWLNVMLEKSYRVYLAIDLSVHLHKAKRCVRHIMPFVSFGE